MEVTAVPMFEPGKVIQEFESKSGKWIAIRYPREGDAEKLVEYINSISAEDTFTETNGHVFTIEEETEWLHDLISKLENGNVVHLVCEYENKLVGGSHVLRKPSRYHRYDHVGIFGIALIADFRGEGIGKILMETTLAEARNGIPGLKMVSLTCFGTNSGGLALYEKMGFKECGRLPKSIMHRGEYVDNVSMYLNLEEF